MKSFLTALKIAWFLVRLPFYALYGAWRLLSGGRALLSRARSAGRLLGKSYTCPCCRYENNLHGRFACDCGAVFMGFVAAPCPVCGEQAAAYTCENCGVSLPLGGH